MSNSTTSTETTATTAETAKPMPTIPPRIERKRYLDGILSGVMRTMRAIDEALRRGDEVEAARLSEALAAAHATLEQATR